MPSVSHTSSAPIFDVIPSACLLCLFCVPNACLFYCVYVITRILIMQYKFISFLLFSFLSKLYCCSFVYYSQSGYLQARMCTQYFSLKIHIFSSFILFSFFFFLKKARIFNRRAFLLFLFLLRFICSQPQNCPL